MHKLMFFPTCWMVTEAFENHELKSVAPSLNKTHLIAIISVDGRIWGQGGPTMELIVVLAKVAVN